MSDTPLVQSLPVQALTPGLLLANKTVHSEASSLLYAQNRFDFSIGTSKHVSSFLEQIGRNNTNYIKHIYIDFPEFRDLNLHDVTLADGSERILAKIQSDCNNLGTLTTSLNSTNEIELELDALDCPKIVAEAVALVDAHFRAISSIREIVVEVYKDGPSSYIRKEMESHGWTVSEKEHEEELGSDRSFADFEDDYDGYDHDISDDDYDIGNDSDFWRRAGD
jgi:hypothetical protein